MLLQREFVHDGHVHRFRVTSDLKGWEVREDEDSTVVRRVHRDDWHRVERDSYLFEMRARALERGVDVADEVLVKA